jgi:hypothetical protein
MHVQRELLTRLDPPERLSFASIPASACVAQ